MANQFVALPAPAGNGSGAAVDVSTFGAQKTFTVADAAGAFVTIEMSNQLVPTNWAPVVTLSRGERTINIAARWMRATVSNYQGGVPIVNIGGDDSGASFATPVAPPANGAGVAIDVSALPPFKTVHIATAFQGALQIQISEDGGATYATALSFNSPGQQSAQFAASFIKVTRNGVPGTASGAPIVNIAATESPGVPAGDGSGVDVEDEGVPIVTPATTLDFVGAGVTVTSGGGGVATVTIPGAAGASASWPYGDGSDGPLHITIGNTFVMDRDYNWTTVLIDVGGTLVTANTAGSVAAGGYVPFASVSFENNGTVIAMPADGEPGTEGAAGANAQVVSSASSLQSTGGGGGGGFGGNGSAADAGDLGFPGTTKVGGDGGGGGFPLAIPGYVGGGATPQIALPPQYGSTRTALQFLLGKWRTSIDGGSANSRWGSGGSGGGAGWNGTSGGGGGGGTAGMIMVIAAPTITGTGVFQALGGNGGAGYVGGSSGGTLPEDSGGGGGGGMGGLVGLVSNTAAAVTVDVSGGTGGLGGGGQASNGQDGDDGEVVRLAVL